jgi:hypothetical protein
MAPGPKFDTAVEQMGRRGDHRPLFLPPPVIAGIELTTPAVGDGQIDADARPIAP